MAGITSVTILRIIQLHLDVVTTIDEFTLINLVPSVGNNIFVLRFESIVSNHLSYSDGVQPKFCSFNSAIPSSCGHY